jgi:undecaprenyl-diphosphatase
MPLALARALDAQAAAIAASMVGRSRRADLLASLLARHLAKLHVLLLILLMVGGRGARGRERRAAAVRMAAALPITIGVVALVGRLIERERPFARHAAGTVLVEHGSGRSFPSRHSACAAAMTTVALPTAPAVGVLMGLGTIGLALSRIYTGLHYPSDVLAGWLIGVGIGIIARRKELSRVLRT